MSVTLDCSLCLPGDELVLTGGQVVPLTVDVLLLLRLHHVLLLETLEGEHGGGVGLSVPVLTACWLNRDFKLTKC